MKIKYKQIGNATAIITVDSLNIGIDPALDPAGTVYEQQRKRVKGPIYNEDTFKNIDLWLITHAHSDHLDKTGSKVIKSKVLTCKSALKPLIKMGISDATVMSHGQTTVFSKGDLSVEIIAVNALHGHNKIIRLFLGAVNGYLIKIKKDEEVKTIYITSDTIYSQVIIDSLKEHDIDFLVGTLGDVKTPYPLTFKPITMSLKEFDKFVEKLKPTYTLATHVDDYSHFCTDMTTVKKSYNVLENGQEVIINV